MSKPSYDTIINNIFLKRYNQTDRVAFSREDLINEAEQQSIKISNIGDILYTYRYRKSLPPDILATQPEGQTWLIEGRGNGKYEFILKTIIGLAPTPKTELVKIKDRSPKILKKINTDDEQYHLNRIRFNKLISRLMTFKCFPIQSHLRTNVPEVGQIEIDEFYAGTFQHKTHLVPVQVKHHSEKLSLVQLEQDFKFCQSQYPKYLAHPVGVYVLDKNQYLIIEVSFVNGQIEVVKELYCELI
jgi:hypothetical protein